MSTTVFITPFLKNATLKAVLRWTLAFCLGSVLAQAGSSALATEITQLRTERADDGVYLSAQVKFELPAVVEDALTKGIAMVFVAEADIYRGRWYWTDKRVASASRSMRLAFQPLTRRWRVNIAAGAIGNVAGLRATLNQNYDTLPEALSAIQRVTRWKIADLAEVDADAAHRLEFRFRLDLSQLPRPFQIGVAGQRDWAIAAEEEQRLQLEPANAAGGGKEVAK